MQSKLDVLDNENLSPKLHQLGATPVLGHLREVHTHYGKVTGASQPTPPADSPELRAKYEALLTSLRHYIGAVLGSIIRRKPETRTLAETLLQPLTDWKTPRPRTRPTSENTPPGDKPPSPAGG